MDSLMKDALAGNWKQAVPWLSFDFNCCQPQQTRALDYAPAAASTPRGSKAGSPAESPRATPRNQPPRPLVPKFGPQARHRLVGISDDIDMSSFDEDYSVDHGHAEELARLNISAIQLGSQKPVNYQQCPKKESALAAALKDVRKYDNHAKTASTHLVGESFGTKEAYPTDPNYIAYGQYHRPSKSDLINHCLLKDTTDSLAFRRSPESNNKTSPHHTMPSPSQKKDAIAPHAHTPSPHHDGSSRPQRSPPAGKARAAPAPQPAPASRPVADFLPRPAYTAEEPLPAPTPAPHASNTHAPAPHTPQQPSVKLVLPLPHTPPAAAAAMLTPKAEAAMLSPRGGVDTLVNAFQHGGGGGSRPAADGDAELVLAGHHGIDQRQIRRVPSAAGGVQDVVRKLSPTAAGGVAAGGAKPGVVIMASEQPKIISHAWLALL